MNNIKSFFWKKFRVKKADYDLSILNSRQKAYKPLLLLLPSVSVLLLFTIIPFIIVIIQSFTVQTGFLASQVTFGFDQYWDPSSSASGIFQDDIFKKGIINSIVYTLTALPISLVISILVSSAIVALAHKWLKGFWQTIFFLPYVTSAVAVSLTFFYLFDTNSGIINSIAGKKIPWLTDNDIYSWKAFFVILVNGVWGNLAFQILIITTAMLSVNPTLYKSASIDGSYKLKQFFSITFPSIKNTITFLITIGVIGGIKVFPLVLFNNNPQQGFMNGGSTIMLYIYGMISKTPGKAAAASLVLFILGVIVSYTIRKLVSVSYTLSTNLGVKRVSIKLNSSKPFSKKTFKL